MDGSESHHFDKTFEFDAPRCVSLDEMDSGELYITGDSWFDRTDKDEPQGMNATKDGSLQAVPLLSAQLNNLSVMAAVLSEENNGDDLTKPFDFADVTFLVEDKRIYYNRGMLAMHSPHFKRLFYGADASHDTEIRLTDEKFDDVLTMLKLLKLSPDNAEQLIADENLEDLLMLAEKYQLSQVTALCEKFLLIKWKFDKSKIVKALDLSAKFGLHTAIKDLLVMPCSDYPSLITDGNVEQVLAIAKEYQLANIIDFCEKYLLQHWKQSADKIVRAVELSAKFGLEKALANLLKPTGDMQANITDDNIEQLLNLCKEYSLFEVQTDCESYIMKTWITKTEKALRAVEIAHEFKLPHLAKAFIPLAACRPLAEIDLSIDKLPTELFCAIVHAAFVRVGEGLCCTPKELFANANHHNHAYYDGNSSSSLGIAFAFPKHKCGKTKIFKAPSISAYHCTCADSAPSCDPVVEVMLKRNEPA